MAICFPDYGTTEDDVRANAPKEMSGGERRVFLALRTGLDNGHHVFSRVRFHDSASRRVLEREIDFVIVHPKKGMLVVEAKGGGIDRDAAGNWTSIGRAGRPVVINDPFDQARNALYALYERLNRAAAGTVIHNRFDFQYAVFFPDMQPRDVIDLLNRSGPPYRDMWETVGSKHDLQAIADWLDRVWDSWNRGHPGRPLGQIGVQLADSEFGHQPVTVRPPLATELEAIKEVRWKLTRGQLGILKILGGVHRAVILGGAGTGKTVLAMEKARRLAQEGPKTLFTCHNKFLADWQKHPSPGVNLTVSCFADLADQLIGKAQGISGRDFLAEERGKRPGDDAFFRIQPRAMIEALKHIDDRFEAIVADEAQDFGRLHWEALTSLLRDMNQSPLYIFGDPNQNLYARNLEFPQAAGPFHLTDNLRNTSQILDAFSPFYKGSPELVPHEGIPSGPEPEFVEAPDITSQAQFIRETVADLAAPRGGKAAIAPDKIVILVAGGAELRDQYIQALKRTGPMRGALNWDSFQGRAANNLLVETVDRFRGLERDLVFLTGFDALNDQVRNDRLYVGMSRAKARLYLVGAHDPRRPRS